MSERPRPLVLALLASFLLLRLAVLAAVLAIFGWFFFSMLKRDFPGVLIASAPMLLVGAASFYVGGRLALKHRRQSQQALEEYRERVCAKRQCQGQPPDGEGPDSKAKP